MAILRRYQGTPTFQDAAGNTFSGRYKKRSKDVDFFVIKTSSPTTLDMLAMKYYNTPLLFWVIQDMNDIIDPMKTIPPNTQIKIPQL